jgi:hypothetical protein
LVGPKTIWTIVKRILRMKLFFKKRLKLKGKKSFNVFPGVLGGYLRV